MTEPARRQPTSDSERVVWGEHPISGPQSGGYPGGDRGGEPGDDAWAGGAVRFGFPRPAQPNSEAGLRQYLITRALGRAVLSTVQWSGIVILVLAAACWLGGAKVLAVLIGLVAVAALLVGRLLATAGRRLSGAERLGAAEPQVRRLVARTGRGLRRELRRVGLPASPLAPLLIALRLLRPYRRAATAQRLARIDLSRVVPADQLDELHLLLQSARQAPSQPSRRSPRG